MKISTVSRQYLLTFLSSGHTYPITSEDAQRLLDEYPAIKANSQRVILQGHNTARANERSVIVPATRGGGAAFIIER